MVENDVSNSKIKVSFKNEIAYSHNSGFRFPKMSSASRESSFIVGIIDHITIASDVTNSMFKSHASQFRIENRQQLTTLGRTLIFLALL